MNVKRNVIILLSIFILFGIVGCSRHDSKGKVGIRGDIKEIKLSDDKETASILVEGKIYEDTDYDKAMIRVDKKTKIHKLDSKDNISINDLKEGMKVEVIFTGPIAESYPVQGAAEIIRIVE